MRLYRPSDPGNLHGSSRSGKGDRHVRYAGNLVGEFAQGTKSQLQLLEMVVVQTSGSGMDTGGQTLLDRLLGDAELLSSWSTPREYGWRVLYLTLSALFNYLNYSLKGTQGVALRDAGSSFPDENVDGRELDTTAVDIYNETGAPCATFGSCYMRHKYQYFRSRD